MGIDAANFLQLVALSRKVPTSGRMLTLGRQWYLYRPENARRRSWFGRRPVDRFQAALDRFQVPLRAVDLMQADGFSEKMFAALGFMEVESVDRSDFEDATRVWDMNRPVPEDWHAQFDIIFDGGTVEHIFNVPTVFQNVYDMLKVGGHYVSATPFNGWPGHGMYQFGPEIVWSYWHGQMKCKVHACTLQSTDGKFALHVPDPALTGRRSEWRVGRLGADRIPSGRINLWYHIEKTDETPLDGWPQQSDYQAQWNAHASTSPATA